MIMPMHYQLQVVPVEVELHSKRLNSSFYQKKKTQKKNMNEILPRQQKHKNMKNDSIKKHKPEIITKNYDFTN